MKDCYPCPCCGYLTLSEEPPGSFDICPICKWEDDDVQFNNINFRGGANLNSLREARINFKKIGAFFPKCLGRVRPPLVDEIHRFESQHSKKKLSCLEEVLSFQIVTRDRHNPSIVIETLDNPGWSISIDLMNIKIKQSLLKKNIIERSDLDWVTCFIENNSFEGRCGSKNLSEVLIIFQDLIRFQDLNEKSRNSVLVDDFKWLESWYFSQCDGDWEHEYGVKITTTETQGWCVNIDLLGTELEGKNFENVNIKIDETNWIKCMVKNNKFEGFGGKVNLLEVLHLFRAWAENNP